MALVHVVGDRSGATIELRGRGVLDFGSFDPLMLALHPRVVRRARQAVAMTGALSSPSPRRGSGTHSFHVELETRLAQFFGYDSCLLFSSRNQAILSYFSQVLREGDLILVDELVQAPILDIAHLMGARVVSLAAITADSARRECQRGPLGAKSFLFLEATSPKRCETIGSSVLEEMFHVEHLQVVLDESYSVPVVGLRGAGVTEGPVVHQGVAAIVVDTGIAFGIAGAALVSDGATVGQILERSLSLQVESCTSPLLAAALEEAITIAELSTAARAGIVTLCQHLRGGLAELGVACSQEAGGALVSLPYPHLREALELAENLFQKGVYVECVPRGTHLVNAGAVRFALRSGHTVADVDQVLGIISNIVRR